MAYNTIYEYENKFVCITVDKMKRQHLCIPVELERGTN